MSSDVFEQPAREQRRVIYHGRVQGVGFRYTTMTISRRFPVVGYVKNLPDGSVELVAEAEVKTLEEFLDTVAEAFTGNILETETHAVASPEAFSKFGIRY